MCASHPRVLHKPCRALTPRLSLAPSLPFPLLHVARCKRLDSSFWRPKNGPGQSRLAVAAAAVAANWWGERQICIVGRSSEAALSVRP